MISMTHTMTSCCLKNEMSQILEKLIKNKNKLTFFSVIAMMPVDILFEKTIVKIKYVNWFYVTPYLYHCINVEKN